MRWAAGQAFLRPMHEPLNKRSEQSFVFCSSEECVMSEERELIDTGTDKRYVRRNEQGEFKESDDQGRSLSRDVRQHAKTKKPRNQGDKGD